MKSIIRYLKSLFWTNHKLLDEIEYQRLANETLLNQLILSDLNHKYVLNDFRKIISGICLQNNNELVLKKVTSECVCDPSNNFFLTSTVNEDGDTVFTLTSDNNKEEKNEL